MRKLFASTIFSMLVLLSPLLYASSANGKVITKLDIPTVTGYLHDLGFTGHSVDKDGDLSVKMRGYNVWFVFYDEGQSIEMFMGLNGSSANMRKANDWNNSYRYTSASIKDNGAVVLESDLDLEGGVTEENVKVFITTFDQSLGAFLAEVAN